jgi:hypothetical protein
MLTWLARLVSIGAGGFGARAYAQRFVREYIRELVRERLLAGLVITVSQLVLLGVTAFGVRRLGHPLGGRLLGSALVWLLIVFNLTRFVTGTVPEIAEARRRLAGPWGYVVRGLLGISIAKELVEMELLVLALCLVLGFYVRLGVSSAFHLIEPWRQLLALNGW